MIDMITPEKLKNPDIDYGANHLTDALAHALSYMFNANFLYDSLVSQKSYACECKRCDLTHYTSYKRSNCEFCGCDSDQFTCKELE